MADPVAVAEKAANVLKDVHDHAGRLATALGIESAQPPVYVSKDMGLRRLNELEALSEFLKRAADTFETPQPIAEPDPVEPADDGESEESTEEQPADDLDALTVVELRERAKEAGVHSPTTLNKAELIEAIKGKG